MKDLEHRSQLLSTKSVSHRPIFLIFFFLFFFFFLLVCTGLKPLYRPKCSEYPEMTKTDRYDPVSEAVQIIVVSVPVMVPVRKFLAVPADTVWN